MFMDIPTSSTNFDCTVLKNDAFLSPSSNVIRWNEVLHGAGIGPTIEPMLMIEPPSGPINSTAAWVVSKTSNVRIQVLIVQHSLALLSLSLPSA